MSMQSTKELPNPTSKKKPGCLDYIYNSTKLVIPVGPRFQADVPDWTSPCNKDKSDSLKWVGTQVWPAEDNLGFKKLDKVEDKLKDKELIGKGRKESCPCKYPKSVECVKRHVKEERVKLKSELRKAFYNWKFDEMGDEVSNLWNLEEQKKFSTLVKTNRMSEGRSFLKPALASFPSKTLQNIVDYYFNVYVPRRISLQTRAGCTTIDTDDEEGDEVPTSKGSRKRNRAKTGASSSSKKKYLTGRR